MYIGNDTTIEAMPFFGVSKWSTNPKLRPYPWNKEEWYYVDDVYKKDNYTKNAIIEQSIAFAKRQYWKRYQFWQRWNIANYNPYDSDWTSRMWYCSELVWASYMNATSEQINISNAKHISGSKYEFVHVYSLLRSGKLTKFNEILS
jgi:hypothetical protein